MPSARVIRRHVPRPDAPGAAVVAAWRRLTGGGRGRDLQRRTLLACSGGADSAALVIALAAAVRDPDRILTVAHIRHDLRPAAESLQDHDAVRALALRLGLPFVSAEVAARPLPGNLESTARRLRYRELTRLAHAHDSPFVATAHHADDQLETILMAMLRGAGPRGLAGIAESRPLSPRCSLIRPMLCLTRDHARRICGHAHHAWQEDASNADLTRLRAALRSRVLPVLRELRPGAAAHAVAAARLLRDAADALTAAGRLVPRRREPDGVVLWRRDALRDRAYAVVGEALRLAARSLTGADRRDRVGIKHLNPAIRAVRSRSTDPKVFRWSGLRLSVNARDVRMEVDR